MAQRIESHLPLQPLPAATTSTDSGGPTDSADASTTSASDPSPFPAEDSRPTDQELPTGDPALHFHNRRIGRYLLVDELGRGGMGVVIRALDPQLDRMVALKLLIHNTSLDSEQTQRFLSEGRLMATLKHPGLISVLDSGLHQGSPFLVMEYVKGPTLGRKLSQEKSLPADTALRLLAEVARAVHVAHAHGVVHRDIKPGNILLEEGERPRLGDFGVALHLSELAMLTMTGQVLGTPSYMSPEQARGDHSNIGPLSDVYSLGATAFHMLTGRPPQHSLEAVLSRKHGDVPSLRALNPALPVELELLCQKALAIDPTERYASAQALAEDCERFLRGEPVLAARPSLRRRMRWQLHRQRALIVGAVVAFVLAVFGQLGWQSWQERQRTLLQEERDALAHTKLLELKERLQVLWHPPETPIDPEQALQERFQDQEEGESLAQKIAAEIDAFIALPEVRGSRAAVDALHLVGAHALSLGDMQTAEEALARAYVLAEQPVSQRDALLRLSEYFRLTGDHQRLEILDALLKARLPALAPDLARDHRRGLALTRRDLSALPPLVASTRGLFLPLLPDFFSLKDTGVVSQAVAVREYALGAEHGEEGVSMTALLWQPPADQAHPGIQAPPLEVLIPDGKRLQSPPLWLGHWDGSPVLGLALESLDGTERYAGLYRLSSDKTLSLLYRFDDEHADLRAGTAADLDRDGTPEFYLSSNQDLVRLRRSVQGQWEWLKNPNLALNAINSDIDGAFAADLDGDGSVELVVIVGGAAKDIRVYAHNPQTDLLNLKARRRIGDTNESMPYPLTQGTTGILVVRNDTQEQGAGRFPKDYPNGLKNGTYLITYEQGLLQLKTRIPAAFLGASQERVLVGDFNGDAHQDFAQTVWVSGSTPHEQRQSLPHLQLALARPDGQFETLTLPGIQALATAQADSDPASELLVRTVGSSRLSWLGAGGKPLPVLSFPLPAMTGNQTSDAWQRISDLVQLRLSGQLLQQLSSFATIQNDALEGMQAILEALGRNAERQQEHSLARQHYTLLTQRVPHHPAGWLGLARLAEQGWNADAEAQALTGLLQHCVLTPDQRQQSQHRLDALSRQTAAPVLSLLSSPELEPHWRVEAPEWVDWQPSSLVLKSLSGQGELARVPVLWDGTRLMLRFELKIPYIVWGSMLNLTFTPADGSEPLLTLRVERTGPRFSQREQVSLLVGQNSITTGPLLSMDLTSFAGAPVSVRIALDPVVGAGMVEVNERLQAFSLPPQFGGRSRATTGPTAEGVQGPERLYLLTWSTGAGGGMRSGTFGRFELRGLTSRGLRPPPPPLELPLEQAARLLAQHKGAQAQELLSRLEVPPASTSALPANTPSSDEAMRWRWERLQALSLCRIGPLKPCFEYLARQTALGPLGRAAHEPLLQSMMQESPGMMLPHLLTLRGAEGVSMLYQWRRRVAWTPRVEQQNELNFLTSFLTLPELTQLPPLEGDTCFTWLSIHLGRYNSFMSLGQFSAARESLYKGLEVASYCKSVPMSRVEAASVRNQTGNIAGVLLLLALRQRREAEARQALAILLESSDYRELRVEAYANEFPFILDWLPDALRAMITRPSAYALDGLNTDPAEWWSPDQATESGVGGDVR